MNLLKSWYKDKNGNFISSMKLEELLRHEDYRIVKQEMKEKYFISTVWLGVPYGGNLEDADYFETMIFATPEGAKDPRDKLGKTIDFFRYKTLEQAEKGHREVMDTWTEELVK